jgi:hypothetical protein
VVGTPSRMGAVSLWPDRSAVVPNQALQATCGQVLFQRHSPSGRTRLNLVVRPLGRVLAAARDRAHRLCLPSASQRTLRP